MLLEMESFPSLLKLCNCRIPPDRQKSAVSRRTTRKAGSLVAARSGRGSEPPVARGSGIEPLGPGPVRGDRVAWTPMRICKGSVKGDRGSIVPMSSALSDEDRALLDRALRAARDTRSLVVESGARHEAARVFASVFGEGPAVVVADDRTFEAAGPDVIEGFRREGIACEDPFLFGPDVYAEIVVRRAIAGGARTDPGRPGGRGVGDDQRPDEAGGAPPGPALHGGRHGGLDGRLHRLRGVDHPPGVQADVRLPRPPGRRWPTST